MIFRGEFVAGVDLVDVCLWAFTIFFLFLVLYLQREGMREGYPTESDSTGKVDTTAPLLPPTSKTFILPHGRGTIDAVTGSRDTRELALRRTAPWPGAPFEPTGNPMVDGVGPASYAERADVVDLTDDGRPRIVPFRAGDGYEVAEGDPDPRGMAVLGADGQKAGECVDLWIDRSEAIIRYLEVRVGEDAAAKNVLLPMPFANIHGKAKEIHVDAVYAEHFADVPTTRDPMAITRLEEDKVCGYYGGGKLYAEPSRKEPLL